MKAQQKKQTAIDCRTFVQYVALDVLIEAGKVITGRDYVPVPHESHDHAKRNVIAWVKGDASDYTLPFGDACDVAAGEPVRTSVMRRRFLACIDPAIASRIARKPSKGPRYKAEPVSLDDVPNAGWRRVYSVQQGVKVFARSSSEASDWCLWGCGVAF